MNLGRLMAKTKKTGAFTGVIPLDEFRLLITAEDMADAIAPSAQVVLSTRVLRTKDSNKGLWHALMPRKTASP